MGVRVQQGNGTVAFRYFHQDHLGSIAVITDENGNLAEPRDAYDPWGKRRFANGNDDPAGSIVSQTIRGFTGQEMLADVALVHLNGRVYDPYIGRMTSADPAVGDPLNGQTWNRYSYVYNNPLAFTDPTGYCPCIPTVNPQPPQPSQFVQLIGSVFRIAAAAICFTAGPGCQLFMPLVVSSTSAFFAGVTSGSLGVGLKAGVVAVATELAFDAVGTATLGPMHTPAEFGSGAFFANVLGHALVGCGSAVASSGKCGPGALSAAVPAFAGPFINKLPFQAALVANTTLGGLASVAGGGKFANGAVTGAFGYLFNAMRGTRPGEEICPVEAACPMAQPVGFGGARNAEPMGDLKIGETVSSILDSLEAAAQRAANALGFGRGPVYGTRVHTEFEAQVDALGNKNLITEQSYLNGKPADRGTPGSIRVDVGLGPVENPTAVFDLKTGGATLTQSRIEQIQSHLPGGSTVPVYEVRP